LYPATCTLYDSAIMNTWRFIDSGPSPGAQNMAIDEELLRDAAAGVGAPVLRFYAWDPPAVSLGRFQDEASSIDIDACRRLGIDIVRRITGGRAVLHHRELTYSIISPAANALFPRNVLGTYKVIAEGLLAGFNNLGIKADMAARPGNRIAKVKQVPRDPSCFAMPSWYEILVQGRKIVGSAQRRTAGAFLQHGSILMNYDPVLEAEVIRGGGAGIGAVTSIEEFLGNPISYSEVKEAFLKGFSQAFEVTY